MEKLMALYGISSPSGREGKMAKFIIEELKGWRFLSGKTGTETSMRSKATGKATPVSWRTWTRYTGARQALMQPILWRTR